MSDITNILDRARAILDDKEQHLSPMWQVALLSDLFMKPFLDAVENTEDGYMEFGSCCCSEHPPDRTFKVEITIQPHGFTAKRCE